MGDQGAEEKAGQVRTGQLRVSVNTWELIRSEARRSKKSLKFTAEELIREALKAREEAQEPKINGGLPT